jgi:hypothetical protein
MEWIPLIAALFGSTGIAGLLAQGVNHTRTARLRKSVEESMRLAGMLPEGTPSREVLELAGQRDAVRLASMSLFSLPTVFRMSVLGGVILFAIITGFGLAMNDWGSPISSGLWQIIAIMLVYIFGLVFVLELVIKHQRDRIVAYVLLTDSVDIRWDGFVSPRLGPLKRRDLAQYQEEREQAKAEAKAAGSGSSAQTGGL